MTLCFRGKCFLLQGYIDSDLAGPINNNKSTIDYVYILSSTAISLVSQLQQTVAFFTTELEYAAITEAEYVTITKTSKEMI